MKISPKQLGIGEVPAKGDTVYLCRGKGDSRRDVEYFTADGIWACPKAKNGHWYGVVTAKEISQEIANYV